MEFRGQQKLDDDVYGGDVPEQAYMESDSDLVTDAEAAAAVSKSEELETMRKRLQEIEEEAGALRQMQEKVEKEMGATQDSTIASATEAEKEEVDSRSIYVGNVDYSCTPEEPKGFAYVEFVEVEAVQNALLLNETELNGRQLKVSAKRTNIPGMKQYRGRHPSPYFGRPYMPAPYAYPPYTYGRVPRYRRPMYYRPY
ncbi:polyadenylate-binding protein 1-like isoform X2 [Salvia hispanica]|uniref:polyadenylate-binding protein 1-like isoform X2 n=1 Tax=Salvia hispanica TaxID=49212 RepID=UPI002009B147|nr:polyadenylate-binding protein 1-like isoform X2 [Salvia hispanica]